MKNDFPAKVTDKSNQKTIGYIAKIKQKDMNSEKFRGKGYLCNKNGTL
jgi:hypothetical protein